MSVFLCKENVRETLVSQGISLTTSHNTFLYIRHTCLLTAPKKKKPSRTGGWVHNDNNKSIVPLTARQKYAILILV